MKLKRHILFGFIFSTGILYAQSDFRPGYIIKNSGDSIYGQIDYRGDLLMSSICRFKDSENAINEYSPGDITAFRFIDSKYFVSREINHTKVFLEYIIKGKVSIYYRRDDAGDHYYLDKEGLRLTEIPYEEGFTYIDDKKVFFETTKHIGLLHYYMQDAPGFQSRIQTIKKPEHQNLIKLAEDYHHTVCVDEECIIYEKRFPLIGMSITPFAGLTKYNGYDKFVMEFGGYLYLWAPRTSEKLFFKTGLVYHKISGAEVDLNIFKIPVQLHYIYAAHRIQPNISGGINLFNLKLDDYKELSHTLGLNAGLDYKISNKINLSTAFNSDLTPISKVIMNKDLKFDIISYSIIVGLRINL